MGAWDETVFGNDDAADWAGNLVDSDDAQVVTATLERAIGADYLEASDGSTALAAAEIVAAAAGRPLPATAYSERALARAATHPDLANLTPLAINAVQRVTAEDSELRDLWDDAGDPAWAATVEDLLGRLQ